MSGDVDSLVWLLIASVVEWTLAEDLLAATSPVPCTVLAAQWVLSKHFLCK